MREIPLLNLCINTHCGSAVECGKGMGCERGCPEISVESDIILCTNTRIFMIERDGDLKLYHNRN